MSKKPVTEHTKCSSQIDSESDTMSDIEDSAKTDAENINIDDELTKIYDIISKVVSLTNTVEFTKFETDIVKKLTAVRKEKILLDKKTANDAKDGSKGPSYDSSYTDLTVGVDVSELAKILHEGVEEREIDGKIVKVRWRDFPFAPFNESYKVSDMGEAKNIKTQTIVKQCQPNSSTKYLSYKYSGKKNAGCKPPKHTFDLHRVVAKAFLGYRPENLVADHINGNKEDNRVSNLQYVSHSENALNQNNLKNKTRVPEFVDLTKLAVEQIPGFDKYVADRMGNIYNTVTSCKVLPFGENNAGNSSQGYLRVGLFVHGLGRKIMYVHVLVALAYIPNPDNKPFVNHINSKKDDNRVVNLEWCTASENMQHHADTKETGRKVGCYSLDGKLLAEYKSVKEAAEKTNAPLTSIIKACSGERKKAGNYKWEYLDDKIIVKAKKKAGPEKFIDPNNQNDIFRDDGDNNDDSENDSSEDDSAKQKASRKKCNE